MPDNSSIYSFGFISVSFSAVLFCFVLLMVFSTPGPNYFYYYFMTRHFFEKYRNTVSISDATTPQTGFTMLLVGF